MRLTGTLEWVPQLNKPEKNPCLNNSKFRGPESEWKAAQGLVEV